MAQIILDSSNNKIQGDFDSATVNNRTNFQTSTTNATTGIYAVPNGSATGASWQAANSADPTNASKILIATNGSTDVQLVSGINGTGTYLPLSFYNSGDVRFQVGTSGELGVRTGVGTVGYGTSGQVLTSAGTGASPTWSTPPVTLTLLANIATTSGTSVNSGTVSLTPYKQVQIVLNAVSNSGTSGNLTMTDPNATTFNILGFSTTSSQGITGIININLATGIIAGTVSNSISTTLPSVNNTGAGGNVAFNGKTTFSTASTIFTFGASAGAFDAGSILIYGVT